MNPVAEEIQSYIGISQKTEEELMHIGMPRRSGRYPYGSGDNPFQHGKDFLGRINELKKSGFTFTDENGKTWTGDNAVAKSMGLTTSEYRRQVSWATYEKRLYQVETAKALREDGLGATAIGKKMGLNESTVRSLLDEKSEHKMQQTMDTVNFLREQLNEKGMIDVGVNVERDLGISRVRLDLALDYLEKAEGCPVYEGGIPQVTNKGQQTTQKVLCKPGTEHKEIYDYERVKTINEYTTHDDGQTFTKFQYPKSMDSKRLMVRYADDAGPDGITGIQKDGIIELRRGVDDLSLGNDRYSQVRILVDNDRYLKGMAVYSDNMPDGVDVVFNTNKTKDIPMRDVLKKIKEDSDNPFGSLIKPNGQSEYIDKNGKKQLSLINKRAGEGDWSDWKDALPSQFLGKQSLSMAKKQLNLAKADKLAEFDEICKLTNPTIKKHLLEKFADNCDSAAVNLQAAALPGQKYHVIIPVNTLKDTEIYAPNYANGTKLALVRYPHGGTFEIPIVTVNNKHAAAKRLLGTDIPDAVAINSKVAERLSGADFDGDTVMCIPTHDAQGRVKIASKNNLKGLEGFDPKTEYPEVPGMKIMKDTGKQMGVISNLITDMTLAGANEKELAQAVRHSMVVIDAEKHHLDYKRSEVENNIAALKKKYQLKYDENGIPNGRSGGASTILSRAKGEYTIDRRQGTYKINAPGKDYYDPTKPDGAKLWKVADDLYYPESKYNKTSKMKTIKTADGNKVVFDVTDKKAYEKYNPVKRIDEKTGEVYFTDKSGDIVYKTKTRTQPSTNMAETDDAYTLVSKSKHPMEIVYADYANSMKDLGNKARLELDSTGKIAYSAAAKKEYQEEVTSLMNKVNNALLNTTRERQAMRLANVAVKQKTTENPNMSKEDIRKANQQAITKARAEVGAIRRKDRNIDITDREWEAIQAGAITETKLKDILNNTDIDMLRNRAMPKATTTLSAPKVNQIKRMAASNYTLDEIAKKLGISSSSVSKYLKESKKGA